MLPAVPHVGGIELETGGEMTIEYREHYEVDSSDHVVVTSEEGFSVFSVLARARGLTDEQARIIAHMFPGPLRGERRFPGCRPRPHHPARRIVPPVLRWARSDRRSTPTPLGRDVIG
jgi:hypothetical protein